MKKTIILLLISMLFLTSCDMFTNEAGETLSAEQVLTYVAETVSASLSLTPQATETYTPTVVPTATSTHTPIPSPSATSTFTIVSSEGTGGTSGDQIKGCDNATFVSDVNIPDGTEIQPGETFTKTWRIQNSGSCAWTTAYSVFFLNGSGMGGISPQILTSEIAPGYSHDISIQMVAPDTPGTYTGYWQLKNAAGQAFGHNFYVQIVVPGDGNTTPTLTPTGPTPTPANTSATCAGKPDLGISGTTHETQENKFVRVSITVENDCDVDAGIFLVEWWLDQSDESADKKHTWEISLAANSSKTLEYECVSCADYSGSYTSRVFVDATSKIDESDEGNNNSTWSITVP